MWRTLNTMMKGALSDRNICSNNFFTLFWCCHIFIYIFVKASWWTNKNLHPDVELSHRTVLVSGYNTIRNLGVSVEGIHCNKDMPQGALAHEPGFQNVRDAADSQPGTKTRRHSLRQSHSVRTSLAQPNSNWVSRVSINTCMPLSLEAVCQVVSLLQELTVS